MLHIREGKYHIYNISDDQIQHIYREKQTIDIHLKDIEKHGYTTFMEKEIKEQPYTLAQTMRGRICMTQSQPSIKLGGIQDHLFCIQQSTRLVFIACGSSMYACIAARYAIEAMVTIPIVIENANDFMDRGCPVHHRDTLVFVSQSGETADVLQVLAVAKHKNAFCVGVTNSVASTLARETSCGIYLNAGCEVGVASTKSYTSQLSVLIMFGAMISTNVQMKNEIIPALSSVAECVQATLAHESKLLEVIHAFQEKQNVLIIGRGADIATALEAGLKLKEIAYVHAEGISGGELKHGPLALIDPTITVIVIATHGVLYERMLNVVRQLKTRGAKVIIVGHPDDDTIGQFGYPVIYVEQSGSQYVQSIVNVIPFQLLAYHIAKGKNINVDKPRNLAKSVTVTD
jgi:glucosamine--fructose-6-phosphate aminotransferase (isomerizing)